MDPALTYSALHAIGLAVGAALCALLTVIQRRVDRASSQPSGYQILWIVGFIWSFGGFIRDALQLAGVDGHATSIRAAVMLAWSGTVLGPIAIGRFVQTS